MIVSFFFLLYSFFNPLRFAETILHKLKENYGKP